MGAEPAPLWVSILRIAVMVGVIVFVDACASPAAGSAPASRSRASSSSSWSSSTRFSPATPSSAGTSTRSAATARAAELSGVKLKRVNFFVMMNMSVLAALAGMIFVARSAASGPQDGNGWELDAIAAVFIGGAAVSGGIGTVIGSIVGGLVMAVLNNGLQLLGVGTDRVQIIKGLVLLLAVALDVYNKSQGRSSIIGSLMRAVPPGGHPPPPARRRTRAPRARQDDGGRLTVTDRNCSPRTTIKEGQHSTMRKILRQVGGRRLPSRCWPSTACGSGRDGDAGSGSSAAAKGFAADALIGVALPAKTSENWVLAGDLFTNGLKEAGFKADVQYAGASTTVADQQAQITAMVTKGAKVIIIGATDGAQLADPGRARPTTPARRSSPTTA